MKGKTLAIVAVFAGAFTIYWAQTHSPKAGLGQIVGNELSGSYTMNETQYYICLGIGIALGILGVYKFFK
jgi:hypothetical protein